MTDKPAPARSEPRRAEEIQTGKEDRRESGTVAAESDRQSREIPLHPDHPAPSPEPQGSEGQRWTLHVYDDGSGHTLRSHEPNEGSCSSYGKEPQVVVVVPASLLAVAEANAAAFDKQATDLFAECNRLTEALRVAEERAETAVRRMTAAMDDQADTHAKLADGERKREEAVGLLHEVYVNSAHLLPVGTEERARAFLAAEPKRKE